MGQRLRRWRKWLVRVTLLAIGAFIVWFIVLTGPRNLDQYPSAADSPYRLPWPHGVEHLCIQGNRAVVSHRGFEEFAYDFAMPVGSDVCAARAGIVKWLNVEHDGNGLDAPNNYVAVLHEDGTTAWYLHLRQGGSYVTIGDRVAQGQRIAASGNVGISMLPHLHFDVRNSLEERIPVTFSDVTQDRGIPRMFKSYTSGNQPSQ